MPENSPRPAFTKHHYEAISNSLRFAEPTLPSYTEQEEAHRIAHTIWATTCHQLASTFEADNPKSFNRTKFLAACGISC